jgi:flagellar protein FliO/FliZ
MSLVRTSAVSVYLTRGWRVLACAGIFLAASAVRAAEDDKVIFPAGGTKAEAPAPTTASVANSLTLVLGVALAGVGGWFVWRNRQRASGTPNLRALSIAETKSLGNRQYLVVASYEGKRFLLGVCPGRIDMLTSLDAAAAQAKSLE